jgi:hypothetical protein
METHWKISFSYSLHLQASVDLTNVCMPKLMSIAYVSWLTAKDSPFLYEPRHSSVKLLEDQPNLMPNHFRPMLLSDVMSYNFDPAR